MRLDPINHSAAWLVTGLRGRLFVSLLGYWRDTRGFRYHFQVFSAVDLRSSCLFAEKTLLVCWNFQSVIVICCNFVNIGNTVIFVISVWLFVIFLLLFVAGILRKEKNCNSLLFYFAKISCLRNYSMIVCNFCHVFVIIPWLFIILVIISVFVIISKLFIIFILLFIVVNLWFVVILFWKKEMHFIFERKYVAWFLVFYNYRIENLKLNCDPLLFYFAR